jgi:hypothetical protein
MKRLKRMIEKQQRGSTSRALLPSTAWMLRGLMSIAGLPMIHSALAQECSSPYSPDCTPGGGISPPSGACPAGQAPVGFCTVIICIEVCTPVKTDPPPFTGTSGSGSGGAHGSGGSSGGSSGSGGTGSTGSSTSPAYNFFADTKQLTTSDIDALHWVRTTGATPDGRPTETTTNAPLDGEKGEFMSPQGKERVVAERTNYLNAVEGGLWTCNPFDDIETMTTTIACEQISAGYELPSGYTMVMGSGGLDGDYSNPPSKTTYRNWSEVHDGLTSGRLLDDPTNQTIILASMTASAPVIYLLGAAGGGAVEVLLASEADVQVGLTAGQQVLAAAAVPGAALGSLMQTTTNAIASANRLSTAQVEELTEFMEGIEGTLAKQTRDFQIEALQRMAEMPYAALQNMLSGGADKYVRFLNIAARVMQEEPIRALIETRVNISDLQNEDLAATALRTLSEQAVGTLSLYNPSLASTLMRGLPEQIDGTLGYLNNTVLQSEGVIPVSIRFEPGAVAATAIGPDGVERVYVIVNAILEGINFAGVHRVMHMIYTFPVPVAQRTVN